MTSMRTVLLAVSNVRRLPPGSKDHPLDVLVQHAANPCFVTRIRPENAEVLEVGEE